MGTTKNFCASKKCLGWTPHLTHSNKYRPTNARRIRKLTQPGSGNDHYSSAHLAALPPPPSPISSTEHIPTPSPPPAQQPMPHTPPQGQATAPPLKRSAALPSDGEEAEDEAERDDVARSLGRARVDPNGKRRAREEQVSISPVAPTLDAEPDTGLDPNRAASPAPLPPVREGTADIKERAVRAKAGQSRRAVDQEERVQQHRYDPNKDTRRKAYTTGVDTLVSRSKLFAKRTNATVYLFVARCAVIPGPVDRQTADIRLSLPLSHEVFNPGDNPAALVTAYHSQPVAWPPNPSEEDLAATHPPAPWAKHAIDCPTFTKTADPQDGEPEVVWTPAEMVFDRMHTMFDALVLPGQAVESLSRRAAAAARKDRQPSRKKKPKKEGDGDPAHSAAEWEAGRAERELMASMLRKFGVTEDDIRKAQEQHLADS
ncbi:hypothetical protein P7C70_g5353, partial [Phenoliferia sp. Uapishka_3]